MASPRSEAAIGGSLCVRMRRLPDDFPALVARVRRTDDVLCVLCTGHLVDPHPPFILPAPLVVPPLARRSAELDRIIAEYADDAIAELAAPPASFTTDDHAWVRDHAAASLAEVEAATLRLVAIHTSRNLSHAAARLGMAPVSLSRWLGRRESPPVMLGTTGATMSQVAMQLDELRGIVREIDALAVPAPESFDHADWRGTDQLIVERMAYVLGTIARSAETAA